MIKVINVFRVKNSLIYGNQHSQRPRKYKKIETPKQDGKQQNIKAQKGQKTEKSSLSIKKTEGK